MLDQKYLLLKKSHIERKIQKRVQKNLIDNLLDHKKKVKNMIVLLKKSI